MGREEAAVSGLGFGRVHDSIDKSGLALDFGAEPISRAVLAIQCSRPADPAYAPAVRAAREKAGKQLETALANCRAIGWKSAVRQ